MKAILQSGPTRDSLTLISFRLLESEWEDGRRDHQHFSELLSVRDLKAYGTMQ